MAPPYSNQSPISNEYSLNLTSQKPGWRQRQRSLMDRVNQRISQFTGGGSAQPPLGQQAQQSKPLGAEYDLTSQYGGQGMERLAGQGAAISRPGRVAGSSILSELPASQREPIPFTKGPLSTTQRSLRQVNELAGAQRPGAMEPIGESIEQYTEDINATGGGADQRRAEYDALQAGDAAEAAGVEEEQIRRNQAIRDGLQRDAMGDAAGPMAYGPDATPATVAEGREIGAQQDPRYTGMRGRMNAQPGTPLETEDTLRGAYNQNYRPGIDDPSTRYPTFQRNPNQAADMAQGMQDVAEVKQGRMRVVVDKDTGKLLQPAEPGSDAQKRYEQGTEISLDDYRRMKGYRSPGAPASGEEGPVGHNRSEVPKRIIPETGEVIGSSDKRWNAAVDITGGKSPLLDKIQRDRRHTQAWRDDPDKGGGMSSALKTRLENKDRALKRNMRGKPIYNKKGKLIGRRKPTIGLGEYVDSMSKVEGGLDYLASRGMGAGAGQPAGVPGAAPPVALGSGANPDRPALAGPSAVTDTYDKSEFGEGYKPESMEAATANLNRIWTGTMEQDKAQRGILSQLGLDANSTREDYISAMTQDRWKQYDKLDDANKFQKAAAIITALQAMNVLSGEGAGKGLGMDTIMKVDVKDQESVFQWMTGLQRTTRKTLEPYQRDAAPRAPVRPFDESSDVLPPEPSMISVFGPDGVPVFGPDGVPVEVPLQRGTGPTFQPPAAPDPLAVPAPPFKMGVPDYLRPPAERTPQSPVRGGPLVPGYGIPGVPTPDMVVPGIGDNPNLWDRTQGRTIESWQRDMGKEGWDLYDAMLRKWNEAPRRRGRWSKHGISRTLGNR